MKKIVSMLVIFCFTVLNGAVAFAADISPDVSEQLVQSGIGEMVTAYMESENGETIPAKIEVIDMSVTPQQFSRSNSLENTYTMTVRAAATKNTSNSNDLNERVDGETVASATSTLIMNWTDNLGTDNKINFLQGSTSVSTGKWKNAKLSWGATISRPVSTVDVAKSFKRNVNWSSETFGWVAAQLRTNITGEDGDIYMLTVNVNPAIWD